MLAGNEEDIANLVRDNPAAIAIYLSDNFEENEILKAKTALSLVTRAHNVQILARDAGLRRDTLYRTFGGRIDPQLSRVLRLLEALNVKARGYACVRDRQPERDRYTAQSSLRFRRSD
ncbi:putative addiction module antidote protein [Bradyrhizobium sp. i1.4.4]